MNSIHAKQDLVFLRYDHPCISLQNNWIIKDDHAIGLDMSCLLRISLRNVSWAYGLFMSHPWSGKIIITENEEISDFADLYSSFGYKKIIPLRNSTEKADTVIEVNAVCKSEYAQASQMVFFGVLLLKNEYCETGAYDAESDSVKEFGEQHVDNEEFQKLQEEMVDNWVKAIEARGERVEDVVQSRFIAYRKRIRNGLVYANQGDRMLDIGAGNLFEKMLTEVIMPAGVDYWTFDIDHRVVEGSKALFSKLGLDPGHALQGENTILPFEDGSFDLVFSSHCIEHSRDLPRTFAEVRRVLNPGGRFTYAVPFGWDDTKEHIYALNIEDWVHFTATSGFDVLSWHTGKDYPESGFDLFIAAKKTGD